MIRLRLIMLGLTLAPIGCAHVPADGRLATVQRFRAALDADDLDAARAELGPDPRTWYEERTGDGRPWVIGGGRWRAWDEEFRSTSTPGPWHVEPDRVWRRVEEMNEYYRLIERGAGLYDHSYFFDDDGRLTGQMISAPPDWTRPASRFDEFEAWAREHDPAELDYLRPGGLLDPTGDRAVRTRRLANRWRASVGLPPID
ncbi:MAG: hypothetical protein HKO59_01810 [Phycisphaerales bacterium]|nr:hypothetical protein [Phycisphaerae bacterium]NNF43632.1 hypothetical protein [Phycisphaerales bacterium]NNM24718.1 hypothetical protein [Phycisphaerales bacterium]